MSEIYDCFCEHCERGMEYYPCKRFCSRTCKSENRKKRRRQELIDSGILVPAPKQSPKIISDPTMLYYRYEKMKLRSREKYMQQTFGITLEDAEKLKNSVKNCPICGTDKPQGRDKKFVIDHCAEKKKIRGVICNNCNQGIGFLKHDPQVLENAKNYIIKFLSECKSE